MNRRAGGVGAGNRQYRLQAPLALPGHGQGNLVAAGPREGGRTTDANVGLSAGPGRTRTGDLPVSASSPPGPLSVRAQNALKELAVELTGEQPPKGPWTPSRELLLALTADRLARARNCGPQTTREIIAWAHAAGVTIPAAFQVGRSLPEMWSRLVAKASAGVLTTAEVIEALEKSVRRKSVRIPVAFQLVLLQILLSMSE